MSVTRLPSVGFIFVHGQPGGVGQIMLQREAAPTTDDEGNPINHYSTVQLRGFVRIASEQEQLVAQQLLRKVDVVLVCPRSTHVDPDDQVVVAGVDAAYLDGRYRITNITSTEVSVRVLLTGPSPNIV